MLNIVRPFPCLSVVQACLGSALGFVKTLYMFHSLLSVLVAPVRGRLRSYYGLALIDVSLDRNRRVVGA